MEEEEEEVDIAGLCFRCFVLIGSLLMFGSVSDGLHGELYACKGDSALTLCILAETALSVSAWSKACNLMLLEVGSSSGNL